MRHLLGGVVLIGLLGLALFSCQEATDQVQAPSTTGIVPLFSSQAGTETLNDFPVPAGSGIVIAGVGLVGNPTIVQPGTISFNVPGGVVAAYLYWTGHNATDGTDDQVLVKAAPMGSPVAVTGTLIGGPTEFFGGAWSSTQRAEITSMVTSGSNSLEISGMDFTTICPFECQNLGAGVLVIYDDGTEAEIAVKDGNDNAFIDFAPPLDTTVPQTFGFAPAPDNRTATLHMFAASVAQFPADGGRPNIVLVYMDGILTEELIDVFQGTAGNDFDAVSVDVTIPAGASTMTLHALSEKHASSALTGLPASFNWLCAAAVISPGDEPPVGCRVTGGQVDESGICTACPVGSSGNNRFTCGGQAGANTALPPQPSGNWTHANKKGPAGRFVFHAGTPSAPEGTEIDWIACMDPEHCIPAREAPSKQIDFGGVGTFKNMANNCPPIIKDNVVVGETLHYFEVNIDDLGEPGRSGKQDPPGDMCPTDGFGVNSATEFADCDCPDFYRIRIWAGPTDSSALMYEAQGYIKGGNFQIHPLTGFDR